MAFNPGATDYQLDIRQRALDRTTEAQHGQLKRERAERVRKSGERSGLQKLLSAGARGAAADFTGGASEAMGCGGAIDSAMLGTDSEGRAVRNEYGDLVGMASQVGSAMSAKKAGEAAMKLKQQQAADQAMQARLDKLNPRLGMEYALNLEKKNKRNLEALQKHEGGFSGLLNKDVENLDLKPTTVGDWESVLEKAKTPEAQTMDYNKMLKRKGDQPGFVPPKPQEAEPKEGTVALSTKDALEAKRKMDAELKAEGQKGMSDNELGQSRARQQWFSNMTPADRIKKTW